MTEQLTRIEQLELALAVTDGLRLNTRVLASYVTLHHEENRYVKVSRRIANTVGISATAYVRVLKQLEGDAANWQVVREPGDATRIYPLFLGGTGTVAPGSEGDATRVAMMKAGLALPNVNRAVRLTALVLGHEYDPETGSSSAGGKDGEEVAGMKLASFHRGTRELVACGYFTAQRRLRAPNLYTPTRKFLTLAGEFA